MSQPSLVPLRPAICRGPSDDLDLTDSGWAESEKVADAIRGWIAARLEMPGDEAVVDAALDNIARRVLTDETPQLTAGRAT